MTLGLKLKSLREENKQSLQFVADSVDVSKTHIWELERGTSKNPSIELIKKLAIHFKVTIDHLTSEQENNTYQAFARELEEKQLADDDMEFLRDAVKMLEARSKGK